MVKLVTALTRLMVRHLCLWSNFAYGRNIFLRNSLMLLRLNFFVELLLYGRQFCRRVPVSMSLREVRLLSSEGKLFIYFEVLRLVIVLEHLYRWHIFIFTKVRQEYHWLCLCTFFWVIKCNSGIDSCQVIIFRLMFDKIYYIGLLLEKLSWMFYWLLSLLIFRSCLVWRKIIIIFDVHFNSWVVL